MAALRFVAVVLSYNGLEDTRKCLRSVEPALRPYVTPLLVDNGSTDGTFEAVGEEFPWCQRLRVEQNRGPAAGNNAGMRWAADAGADWIVLLNNDTTVSPLLFERLRDAAVAHPWYAVLGPVIRFMDDPDVVMTDGCLFNVPEHSGFFRREPVALSGQHPPAVTPVDIVNGCCLMIRTSTVERIGGFDESFFMYHDEADLCLRVLRSGGRLGVIDHALVWHKGSASSITTGKRSIRYFDARNLRYLLKKHDGFPEHGRSRLRTRFEYWRYMYYWYAAELEAGNAAAAEAVLEGVSDGLLGRSGAYTPGPRRYKRAVRLLFEAARRRPRSRPAPARPPVES